MSCLTPRSKRLPFVDFSRHAASRDDVLAASGAKTRDEFARMQHKQGKVRMLLDNGRSLTRIIENADAASALAVAGLIETLPQVLESNSGGQRRDHRRMAVRLPRWCRRIRGSPRGP